MSTLFAGVLHTDAVVEGDVVWKGVKVLVNFPGDVDELKLVCVDENDS